MYFTKMSKSTICNAISEVCAAINEALQDYAKTPSTEEEWLSIAQEFNEKWNFPNCIGAVDGKHCVIQAPINSGSYFFNYKSTFSVVLMAIVDANYNFIFADIGCQGRISDGGVFRNTSFYQKLQNNELNLPNDQSLPGRQQNMPFVFVADDAFPLQRHIMKPYPGTHARGSEKRIYNYRLSRARRIVENAFGILSAVFRVLRKPMLLQPDKASLVVITCVYLHNYLMKRKASRKLYNSPGMMDRIEDDVVIPGQWRKYGPFIIISPVTQHWTKTHFAM
ncbi:protein ALP1-like [Manduca sexta]|uniref:protein ALP1-like n=1 Tax=Manduca sexta TaxID=7130 RepID=UPI00188DCF10|nr:protein ALP1-like [Manduca sexta]